MSLSGGYLQRVHPNAVKIPLATNSLLDRGCLNNQLLICRIYLFCAFAVAVELLLLAIFLPTHPNPMIFLYCTLVRGGAVFGT